MEVLNDARFNLIETDNLIVKKMNSYIINQDTILSESESGTLFLLNSENNSITIRLPPISVGLNFEFIFNNTTSNSVIFKTSLDPLDTSKFIGVEWLYLKRSDININYSLLSGSELIFNTCEKGEYIKFYCDGKNYYIIEKNDTNNNINNIIVEYPRLQNNNFIVNINIANNSYTYNILNEITTEPIDTLMMNTTYNFKFDTTTTEYTNLINNNNNEEEYYLYTYIEYYNLINYTFITNEKKYDYKYPIFNYKLYDKNNNEINQLDLFNIKYIINLDNNSIKYPGYLYTTEINLDKDQDLNILSKTSILNIDYNSIDNNLVIYNEFNSIIYDHNNDRQFLLANRNIDYKIKYTNTNIDFEHAISNNSIIEYTNDLSFKFSDTTTTQTGFIRLEVAPINTLNIENRLYFIYFKTTISEEEKIYKIPLLFIDQLLLQTVNESVNIVIDNKNINELPKENGIVNHKYKFNIISNENITNYDNLELLFLNTQQSSNLTINEQIFKLMKEKLVINIDKLNINNYLLNFMSTGLTTKYYTTIVKDESNFKIISFNTGYNNVDNIYITYYSQFNNIISGNFKLNQFIIDDSYSGKIIYINLKNNININLKNNINNNFYEMVINDDNILDTNKYTLIKRRNENLIDEYYFIINNDRSRFYKSINLYTNNKYVITLDSTISTLDITRDISNFNDLINFSDKKDGIINFRKTENYNFIKKEINGDTRTLIIDLVNTLTPTKIYYYNKNIKNIGGIINILSVENKLNNLVLNSLNPFTSEYKIFINNISYEKQIIEGIDNYILTLKKLKKGDTIKLYFNNNTNIIRDFKFSDNDDSIIKYPENIISNNNYKIIFDKNNLNNNYDINLKDNNNNLISYSNNSFKFIKNQIYTIEQNDSTNYNLDNNTNNVYYTKLLYDNNNLYYTYFTDSKFNNKINNINLYRGITYKFKQYHRSNYNPDIDIDLNRIFKVTVKKNSSNVNVFYLNDMEQYIPNLLVDTLYYFDISEVIDYNFRLSLYNDGLQNNILTIFRKPPETIYKTNSDNNIHWIKLQLSTTSNISQLYYYSEIYRNMGSSMNIIKSSINYLLSINEKKYDISNSTIEYYLNKNKPVYELIFKNNNTQQIKKNILFYKDSQIPYLKFKINFDNIIKNKLYTTDRLLDVINNPTITIYVQQIFNAKYPKLSYFKFYSDRNMNSVSTIKLPLTLLQNKKYIFKQINYKNAKFKFFMFINEYPLNYINNISSNSTFFDTNILTYVNEEGFTLDTTNLICSEIYYSGIYFSDNLLLEDNVDIGVNNYEKLISNYKILLVPEKEIYISDKHNESNILNKINITETNNDNYELTVNTMNNKNIFNNSKSYIYLKNKNITDTQNITLNINNNYFDYIQTDKIFISNISNSKNNNYDSIYNRDINILKNIQYNFNYLSQYIIKYFNHINNTLVPLNTQLTISDNKSYDYIIYKSETNTNIERDSSFNINGELIFQLNETINIYVSIGNIDDQNNPIYDFYLDSDGTNELNKNTEGYYLLDITKIYKFHRLSNATSHPFYISTTGHKQESNSNITITGEGSFDNGIKNTESFILQFNVNDTSTLNNLKYYCSSHSNMINEFKLIMSTQPANLNDYFTIYNDSNTFTNNVYDYFISVKSDINTCNIVFFDNSIYELISLNYNDNTNNNINFESNKILNINQTDLNSNKILYVNLVLQKKITTTNLNDDIIIYTFKIIKEEINVKILNYGKIIPNSYENILNEKKNIYLSKQVKFNLSDIDKTLPNSDLLNTYTLELIDTEFDSGDSIKTLTSKKFVFNHDSFLNTRNTDTILEKNIVSSNLYVSDYRTITIDISNISLIDENITFYEDEKTTKKLENNIIYRGTPGANDSKIILNINPHIYSILYYYSDCLYESKFKYNIEIKELTNKTIFKFYTDMESNASKEIPNVLDIDIIPFLENKFDIYYNIIDTKSNINLDGCSFILYNSTNLYKGTIICNKTHTIDSNVYYSNKIYLLFNNDFKLYNSLNITTDYIIKIFKYTGGTIYTPNYIYLDKINSITNSEIESNKRKNNIFNPTSESIYTLNNRIINNDFYLKYDINHNNEKFYLSQNNYENFVYEDTKLINQYINLKNETIKYNSDIILNISDTSNDTSNNKEILTRMTNKPFLSLDNTILEQENTINEFNILVNLYKSLTRLIDGIQYYSIKLNVNSFTDTLLVLKPYHSYKFNINKSFLLENSDIYYKIKNINLSLVNVNDTKVLSSDYISIDNNKEININSKKMFIYTLNVNIPEDSEIYTYNKIYLKLSCEIHEDKNTNPIKLNQGYYARNNTGSIYKSSGNIFIEYLPIIIDKKSVINNNIVYKNNNYYINNFINKINIYNYYTNIFDISNINTVDINIFNNKTTSAEIINSPIYKNKNNNKILIYSDKILYKNYDIRINVSNINIKNIFTELLNTNIDLEEDSEYIVDLYKDYYGNDSSNDYTESVQNKYRTKYVGEPGFNGEFIYNLNGILDFNINTNNILQSVLYINNIIYFNNNINKYNFTNDFLKTSNIKLIEPIKLKLMYELNSSEYLDLAPNYTYSDNYFPGKPESKLTIKIPNDIDGDNIFNENIKLVGVGHYSNQTMNIINEIIIPSDIYILPQYNSTIFLNILDNTIIRLPIPNYSLEYKFIVIDSANANYTLTIITNNNIYGYIDYDLNKNIELKNNNKLIFKNIIKGNSFLLTSNKQDYYLENISVNRSNNNNISLINFNRNIIYLPNKSFDIININTEEQKFILEKENIDIKKLYKNKLYNFSTINLSTNYFNLIDLDVLNINNININNPIFLHNYNNLYHIFQKNIPTPNDTDFTNYTNPENNYNFIIKIDINNDKILFNNSIEIPIIYSNYIYRFKKPSGFFILNNFDFSKINKTVPNMSLIDFINISTEYYDITVRKNDIIKHTISTNDTDTISIYKTIIEEGIEKDTPNNNNTITIQNDNFKNLPINTIIYFDQDIYHSYNNVKNNYIKIINKNTLYKTIIEGDGSGDIILEGVVFNNNDIDNSPKLNINNINLPDTNYLNVKVSIFRNSINYNTHILTYIYYKSIIINNENNIFKISEKVLEGGYRDLEFILDSNNYNTYTYDIDNNNLYTTLLDILNDKLNKENYEMTILNDQYKLSNLSKKFNIIETPLSILLGFTVLENDNNIIYSKIPSLPENGGIFRTNDYYKYYGNRINIDYNTLDTTESNSLISIDLDEDKHINLPDIKEGLIYTFIINNSLKEKKLYIHSFNNIYNFINNEYGNIVVIKPNTNSNLNISVSISSNDNKYFISDIKGNSYTFNIYSTKIYNTLNNFSNLYYTEKGISNIDKYFSVYGIHIIGLKDSNNNIINENKFLHVVKTLARILDYNQTNTIYDNNIHNSILHRNSYIMLYNNIIPNDYFIHDKHNNNIFIKYSDININYNHNNILSDTNKYDITLEKLLNLLISNYIYVYPHIFNYNQIEGDISNLDIYKYVDNSLITIPNFIVNNISEQVYIIDNRNSKVSEEFINKYYNTNTLNYSNGSDLSIRINNLSLRYTGNNLLEIKYSLNIINIGKGFKHNDKVSIKFNNIELILTLRLIDLSNNTKINMYNVINSHNQIYNNSINNININELINGETDTIYANNGNITISNIYDYKIRINDKLYTKKLDNNNDIINYVTNLLLSLLGYYKLRNLKNNYLSYIDFNIITPTLVKKYNNKFIGLYFSSSLHNINNLNNIHNYNLDLLNYIKSNDSELLDLDLKISNNSKINEFSNLIKTYDNIIFDNALDFTLTKNNQYATINFVAKKTQYSISEDLPIITNIINNKINNTIIDVSSIKKNDYYNTTVSININITSENNNTTLYNFNLNRTNHTSTIVSIKNINVISNDILIDNINNIDTIDTDTNIYFKENESNTIEIILDNIYSDITDIKINNIPKINDNLNNLLNNYSYKYIFIPNYYKSILNLTVNSEVQTSYTYNLNLIKYPNNIALLDDVIITNVSNINQFDSYNFNYNGTLNKNVLQIFHKAVISISDNISNISLNIKKTDKYSSVNTTIEYYDSNNKYIIYKDTNELFIYDILTFIKNSNTTQTETKQFKTHILNEGHNIYNIIPVTGYISNDQAFEVDIATLDNYNFNKNIFDFIPDNANIQFKKLNNNILEDIAENDNSNTLGNIIKTNQSTIFTVNNYKNRTDLINFSNNPLPKIQINGAQPSSLIPADITNLVMLINSKPFKKIKNDNINEILNLSNISNIKINIKVTSEDKTVENNYVYIINTKKY